MTPAARTVAEILWHRHGTARQSPAAFADEAAAILAALEPHRRRELEDARRTGFEEAMEEARGLPPLAVFGSCHAAGQARTGEALKSKSRTDEKERTE